MKTLRIALRLGVHVVACSLVASIAGAAVGVPVGLLTDDRMGMMVAQAVALLVFLDAL